MFSFNEFQRFNQLPPVNTKAAPGRVVTFMWNPEARWKSRSEPGVYFKHLYFLSR